MEPENLRFSKGTEVLIPRVGEDPMDYNHCTWLSVPNVAIGEMISVFNTDNDPLFTATMFNATLQKEFAMRVEGGSVTNLYYEKLKNIDVKFPQLEEQRKIASYFEYLDNLITLHQCKYTYLTKLLPNVWEQRKLGEVFQEYSEKNHPELPTLTIVQGGGTVLREESDRNLQYDKSSISGYKMVQKDDFIVHLRSFEGGLEKSSHKGLISPAYHTFHGYSIDSRFYYPYFRSYEFIKHKLVPHVYGIRDGRSIDINGMKTIEIPYTSYEEQKKIGDYIESLDRLITLHQCKCNNFGNLHINAWEQRKLGEMCQITMGQSPDGSTYSEEPSDYILVQGNADLKDGWVYPRIWTTQKTKTAQAGDLIMSVRAPAGAMGKTAYDVVLGRGVAGIKGNEFVYQSLVKMDSDGYWKKMAAGSTFESINSDVVKNAEMIVPQDIEEQEKIGVYFKQLDTLITLHQQKYICTKNIIKQIKIRLFIKKGRIKMAELEIMLENKLIEQLIYGDSQWVYRKDLKTEDDLWSNFRYILEQNNKDRLNGQHLSDAEFEQVKNQLQFSSFYKAGEWLVGENGKVQVHVQRGTEKLHLVVMNHEHIAGGSSVYEVINQYSALKTDEDINCTERDRRFDVTLLINGLPMIHIELKNKQHSYMDGFWQIKKYIGEGKFTGIFSAVQMFVISNGVNTKYFSAASDTELNSKFISGWLDKDNNPVTDLLDFAKSVLRIPEAHEMIARYTVLDEDAKKLIL